MEHLTETNLTASSYHSDVIVWAHRQLVALREQGFQLVREKHRCGAHEFHFVRDVYFDGVRILVYNPTANYAYLQNDKQQILTRFK